MWLLIFTECQAFPKLQSLVCSVSKLSCIEYKVKKAKELGLPIPKRELTVIRNPKQEFAAKLEESRTKSQMAGSLATMVVVDRLGYT